MTNRIGRKRRQKAAKARNKINKTKVLIYELALLMTEYQAMLDKDPPVWFIPVKDLETADWITGK